MTAFDTNVLIYSCDKTDPLRRERAIEVLIDTTDGVMLWQVACEFVAASRKLAPQGFTSADAWNRLAEFIDLFPLVSPDSAVLSRARDLHVMEGCSFWDAPILAACLNHGVTRLYSEDHPGRNIPGLAVVNPF